MKVLLTGMLPAFAKEMSSRLTKDGHHVSTMEHHRASSASPGSGDGGSRKSPEYADPKALMKSARFQAVVFFFAYRCDEAEDAKALGALLDDLSLMLRAAAQNGVEHFVLVTDRRVFGKRQTGLEDEEPLPDTPTGILIKTAEKCLNGCDGDERIRTLVLRVTSLYSEDDPESFFSRAACASQRKEPLRLRGKPSTRCDFLHSDDLARFLCQALEARATGVIHLAYGGSHRYRDVLVYFKTHMPDLKVTFTHDSVHLTLEIGRARQLEWVPRHDFSQEIGELLRKPVLPLRPQRSSKHIKRIRQSIGGALPWVETAVLGAAVWALKHAAQTNASLRFVDFGLIYVIVTAASHGSVMGVLSAIIAYAVYVAEWTGAGNDLYLLLFNMDNWLLPAGYLLAGAIFGGWHDRQLDHLEDLAQERAEKDAEKARLQAMFDQIREDRDRLQDQVMRYRDNYGRIYRITRELDTMQTEQVFLSACEMVEVAMQNRTVAVYARKGRLPFARLVAHSDAGRRLPRSLDLREMPQLRESLDQNRLFVNTDLEPGYPAIAAPIGDEQDPLAAIFLWEAPFDKQTLYYTNLLTEVAGLVQAALVRTTRYSILSAEKDMESSPILSEQAFRAVLGVFQDMRRLRMGGFLLARLQDGDVRSPGEYERRLSRAIRSTDHVGYLPDGALCAIFPQAEVEDMARILKRLKSQGILLEMLTQEASYA